MICSMGRKPWEPPSWLSNTKVVLSHALILVPYWLILGTSMGGVYTVDRVADKIDYVHDHIIVLRSGLAAQSQNAAHKVRYMIDSHSI